MSPTSGKPRTKKAEVIGSIDLTRQQRDALGRAVARSRKLIKGGMPFDGDKRALEELDLALRRLGFNGAIYA